MSVVARSDSPPLLDIAVPVYNEERDIEPCLRRLHSYLSTRFPFTFRITVADNASTDDTLTRAQKVAAELEHVRVVHSDRKGRGRALAHVWSSSDAYVLAYTDVDMSTDLDALLPMVAALVSGHSAIAIGSRLARTSTVVRGTKREVISRCYNLILRLVLGTRFRDAQCGFKAIRADVARALLRHVRDTAWFFDTELLVLAERADLRVLEIPVDWVDDPDSRVQLVRTALDDLRGVARLLRSPATVGAQLRELGRPRHRRPASRFSRGCTPWHRQLLRFAIVGSASTAVYLLLYLLARGLMVAQLANLVALTAASVGNAAANRAWTFRVRGRAGLMRHHLQALLVFAVGLAATSGALAFLSAYWPDAGRTVDIAVLMCANSMVTLARFVAMRTWIFRRRPGPQPAPAVRRHSALPSRRLASSTSPAATPGRTERSQSL